MKRIIPVMMWGLAGCMSLPVPADPNTFYKRDMDLFGQVGIGIYVLPKNPTYKITGSFKGNTSLFTFATCHREYSEQDPGDDFKYVYTPVSGIEDGYCPINIGGFDSKRGQHTWGFIDIEDDSNTLPATLKCNGEVKQTNGVSVCQSRVGLLEEIDFKSPVDISPSKECPMDEDSSGLIFKFDMPKALCVFVFREKAAPHRLHRLTTLGYQNILIREN